MNEAEEILKRYYCTYRMKDNFINVTGSLGYNELMKMINELNFLRYGFCLVGGKLKISLERK